MKSIVVLLVALFSSVAAWSQGKINGRITDIQGQPIFGVVVVVEENNSLVTQSDFDGLFTLKLPDASSYTLRLVLMGYQEIKEVVQLKDNASISKEYTLLDFAVTGQEIEIVANVVKSAEGYMEKVKINSAVTLDYISSETIKKTGDSNVINAVARVSGVSTNGGLITVRGIGDRYVRTTLNGSRIPTLDPLTNNIKLDIFPASLVDNIVITKTQSSEYASDWAGAYLSVETKDYPDQLTVNVETQIGYNSQSTFRDFITSERSGGDWMGFDNGLRQRENTKITAPNLDPSTYQQLVALGLGNYYAQQGVHGWTDGSAQAEQYFRMGLVQLGLLPAGQINDQAAFEAAKARYQQEYKPVALNNINPNGTNYSNGFSNSWNTRWRKAPLNFSQSFGVGNQIELFEKKFGYFIGFRYGSVYRYDPDGISQRVGDETLGYPFERQDYAQISRETHSWSALVNLAYELNSNNKVSFLFMPNFLGSNDVASYTSMELNQEFQDMEVSKNIFYEQRKQLIYQIASSHFIPKGKIKVDLNASYTDGASVAPDFKATQYTYVLQNDTILSYQYSPTAGDGIRRYYRYLDENLLDSRVNVDIPIGSEENKLNRKIKLGGAYTYNYRKVDNDEYRVMLGNNAFLAPIANDDIDAYMSEDRFIMRDGVVDFTYLNFDFDRNHSFGNSHITAYYIMSDYELNKRIRLTGGLRLEQTDIFTDVDKYYLEGYERNDPRRLNVGGFPFVNAASIKETNLLPNLSLVYKIQSEKVNQTNLRFNYSQSLARPSMRELSDAAIYDNEFRTLIYGNSDLKIAHVTNYDFRGETYFKNGDNLSVSLFYKSFKNHIEMGFGSAGITWENIAESSVQGIELEGKKNITPQLEFRANLTLVKSNSEFVRRDFQTVDGIKTYTIIDTLNRAMYGQAPYLINALLSYSADSLGLTATISYNVQGPRLVIAGAVKGRADVFELPRHTIDFKISKTLSQHFTASLTVRDILNAPVRRSYKLPTGWVDYDNFQYGTNFLIGLSYKL